MAVLSRALVLRDVLSLSMWGIMLVSLLTLSGQEFLSTFLECVDTNRACSPSERPSCHEEFYGKTLFQFYVSISSTCFYFSVSSFALKLWTSGVRLINSISVPVLSGFKLHVSCLTNQVDLYDVVDSMSIHRAHY
ncbi:unnamed protein product [Cuscuta epithymum]|uniref:Uncharacterized protein n=1 Tax=Cuscuta epithymum TaxID=186058 RepID=A0AAV0C1F7_9ASTE|nr:unnamed protein product [Cuscuta epithymum]